MTKSRQIRSGLSYILVILMVFSIPFFYKDAYSVYAADDYTIDLSTLSGDLEIRSSGGSIWVNTGSGIISTGVPDTEQVVLTGELTKGAVKVNSSSSNQEELNIKLSGASIENPNSSDDTFTVTSDTALEIELSGDNYITNAAATGSAILMSGSETDLTITGSGFLSTVMSGMDAQGSAIGGGYVNGTNIAIGDIVISNGAKVYAEIYEGTGIGGGYAENSQLSTGEITVENSSVSSIVKDNGSGIGGGYAGNGQLSIGEILVENSSVNAVVNNRGTGIGGGYARLYGELSTGDISVENSSVSAIVILNGSGIGGGYVNDSGQLSTGEISVESSSVSAIVNYGAGIGGGCAYIDGQLNTGEISVENSSVSANVRDGAGIGGGYAGNGQLSTGEILVESSSVSAIVSNNGSGVGGGYTSFTGQLGTGVITLDGGYITASAGAIDIGEGYIANGGIITVPSIHILGGSVYAVNDKIDPAPTDGSARTLYRVTVPAISQAGGDLITAGSYTARTVTGADEHGSTFNTGYPSAGAFIYLPEATHTGIDIGTLKGGVAKVKDTLTALDTYDNTVMFPKRMELAETSKTIKVGESFTVSAIVTPQATDWYYAPSSNDYTVTDTNPGVVNFTSSSGILTVTGDAVGSTQLVYNMVDAPSVTSTLNITVSDQSSPSPDRFLIKTSSSTGGSISESGDIYVSKGGNKTFTFTPDDKYRIKDVIVNGKSVGTPSFYTFNNVQSNHTLSVVFERHFPFTDVPNAWFREPIEYVYFSDLMNGISGTLFDPQGDMSRSMFVSTLGRMDGVSDGPSITGFTDTDNTAYYASHVKWSRENGVVKGISESLFAPNDTMTREQAATLIVRYAEYLGKDLSTSGVSGFKDIDQAGSWAKDSILKAQNAGLMLGVGDNRFDPKKELTRAEMAQVLMNYGKNL